MLLIIVHVQCANTNVQCMVTSIISGLLTSQCIEVSVTNSASLELLCLMDKE